MPIVATSELVVIRGDTTVLRGVSLEVGGGESLGIAGHNGSGKTTLLRVLATLLRPTSGTATVLGADVGSNAVRAVRHRIGLLGHAPALSPHLTLEENLRYVAALTGASKVRVGEVLRMVGLDGAAQRLTAKASQGMARRVDLARLLLTDPVLLLLDEPFAGLDSEAAGIIGAIVERTTSRGGTAVVVSHDPDRAAAVTDSVITLSEGRLQ